MTPLSGQNAIVTGAASGLGTAVASELASRGAHVACLDINDTGCKTVVDQINDRGLAASAHHLDVTVDDSVLAAVEEVASERPVDILVNCVGITGQAGLLTHDVLIADFDLVYRVNLRGSLLLSQALLPRMIDRGYGRILHVASIAGKEGNAGMAAYSATKAGLIGLVKTMGKEYAESGVTVNALAPAVIHTPLVEALPPRQVQYMTSRIPMARLGRLEEAANMAAWIVSPECSFTTGFTFDLSGGRAVY